MISEHLIKFKIFQFSWTDIFHHFSTGVTLYIISIIFPLIHCFLQTEKEQTSLTKSIEAKASHKGTGKGVPAIFKVLGIMNCFVVRLFKGSLTRCWATFLTKSTLEASKG